MHSLEGVIHTRHILALWLKYGSDRTLSFTSSLNMPIAEPIDKSFRRAWLELYPYLEKIFPRCRRLAIRLAERLYVLHNGFMPQLDAAAGFKELVLCSEHCRRTDAYGMGNTGVDSYRVVANSSNRWDRE